MGSEQVKSDLNAVANPAKARILSGFFKTARGEYGHGDVFIGVTVPKQRKIARQNIVLPLPEIQKLLNSKIHEHRLTGLIILTYKYEKASQIERKAIFDFYLKNTRNINNWDLVDVSCPRIVGTYLLDKGKKERRTLYTLARSNNLWERRIAIVSTLALICKGESKDAFAITELLLNDKHDLMHKAAGWMLREVGKRVSELELETFLKKHYKAMPRTMLRYAIERFSEHKRKKYLHGLIN